MTKEETILFNALLKAQEQLISLNILVNAQGSQYFKDQHYKAVRSCLSVTGFERAEEFNKALKIYNIK